MRPLFLGIGFRLLVIPIASGQGHKHSPPPGDWEHTLWTDGTLTAIQSIQVGMSQTDLERLFTLEGGLHRGPLTGATYIYKECPYIKVVVKFTKDRKINRISRPYLERPTRAAD